MGRGGAELATSAHVALALALLVIGAPGLASDAPLGGARAGHPRDRFPLAVHLAPGTDPPHETAVQAAVAAWNRVFADTLGGIAFRWHDREEGAQVLLRVAAGASGSHLMGETWLAVGPEGTIGLPVRITLVEPAARGQTSSQAVLFQVTAHELGHALGLPHANQPGSLMCCDRGALNFQDPTVRATYIAARRHPDVGSVAAQLVAHYRAFWTAPQPVR